MPKNAIRSLRRRLGLTQSELARLANTSRQQIGRLEEGQRKLTIEWATVLGKILNCKASDLLFPENASLGDGPDYRTVFLANEEGDDEPAISFHLAILKKLNTALSDRLELYEINTNDVSKTARKGDFLLVDRDATNVTRPGVHLIDIGGIKSWRYLSPSATGRTILVHSDNAQMAAEATLESELTIVGRAVAKLTPL